MLCLSHKGSNELELSKFADEILALSMEHLLTSLERHLDLESYRGSKFKFVFHLVTKVKILELFLHKTEAENCAFIVLPSLFQTLYMLETNWPEQIGKINLLSNVKEGSRAMFLSWVQILRTLTYSGLAQMYECGCY